MKRVLATLFITTVAIVLAVYSAWRSLDFISLTIPPEQQAMGFLALLATEGGIFCWMLYFLFGAGGAWQRGISLVMTIVDLCGSVALFSADTLLRSGQNGLVATMAPDEIRLIILALSGLIALNVAATIACHLFDPAHQRRAAEQEAFDEVENLALATIRQNSQSLAAELAPVLAADWIADARARYLNSLRAVKSPALPAEVIDASAADAPVDAPASAIAKCYLCGRPALPNVSENGNPICHHCATAELTARQSANFPSHLRGEGQACPEPGRSDEGQSILVPSLDYTALAAAIIAAQPISAPIGANNYKPTEAETLAPRSPGDPIMPPMQTTPPLA